MRSDDFAAFMGRRVGCVFWIAAAWTVVCIVGTLALIVGGVYLLWRLA